MAVVTGYTAERMAEIEANCIVAGAVDLSGHLILTRNGGGTVDAGEVIGPPGPSGTFGGTAGGVDNGIPRANGTGGVTLQASLASIDDAGVVRAEQFRANNEPTQPYHLVTKAYADVGSARPGCIINAPGQAVPNASVQNVSFTSADTRDTHSFHNPLSLSGTRVYIPIGLGGWYSVFFRQNWSTHVTGIRQVYYSINGGAQVIFGLTGSSGGYCMSTEHVQVQLADSDYIQFHVYQNSGGDLNLNPSTVTMMRDSA
jgi:putative alpha-1,2-mannosidase